MFCTCGKPSLRIPAAASPIADSSTCKNSCALESCLSRNTMVEPCSGWTSEMNWSERVQRKRDTCCPGSSPLFKPSACLEHCCHAPEGRSVYGHLGAAAARSAPLQQNLDNLNPMIARFKVGCRPCSSNQSRCSLLRCCEQHCKHEPRSHLCS